MLLPLLVLFVLGCRATNCYAETADGKYFDLLDMAGQEVIANYATQWQYKVTICADAEKCGTAPTSGYCQTNPASPAEQQWSVGKFTSFSVDNTGTTPVITLSYTGGEEVKGVARQGTVVITCDPTAAQPTDKQGNNPQDVTSYKVTFRSASACAKPKPKGGPSGGTVLLIIVFVCLPVYFIAGIVYNKVKHEATGIDLIPNVEFWMAIPGLVKEGCLYTFNKITGRG